MKELKLAQIILTIVAVIITAISIISMVLICICPQLLG